MGATPKEMLSGLGENKNPFDWVLKGLSVRKSVEVWDGFVSTIVKMMSPEEGAEGNPMLLAMLMPMLPAYMMQFRGTLDMEVDGEAVEQIFDTIKELAPEELKKMLSMSNADARDMLSDMYDTVKKQSPSRY